MVYPALLPLMRTPRLPVVDRTDAPADLNELARFAERRNLVSVLVPSHFNWPLLPADCCLEQKHVQKCTKMKVCTVVPTVVCLCTFSIAQQDA